MDILIPVARRAWPLEAGLESNYNFAPSTPLTIQMSDLNQETTENKQGSSAIANINQAHCC